MKVWVVCEPFHSQGEVIDSVWTDENLARARASSCDGWVCEKELDTGV